jgi:flagellar biosynthesis/type III secretory pathway chaperone
MTAILPSPEKLAPSQELSLYRELLECLEEEWHALVNSREDNILALAAQKEHLLEKLIMVNRGRDIVDAEQDADDLRRLKRQAAQAQARNHRLITTTLETIQDFLSCLQSAPPGTYHSAGKVETAPGSSFFHRQA